jgi:hypothetical protein
MWHHVKEKIFANLCFIITVVLLPRQDFFMILWHPEKRKVGNKTSNKEHEKVMGR